jgi:hypothetical protein
MSRFVTAALVVIAMVIAVPAAATVNETNPATPDVYVELNIGCFTNVYWNNADVDHQIFFNDIVQNGSNTGDWYSAVLTGAYLAATKASQDAWATGYYESYDDANFWFQANCDVQMTITTGGDLKNSSAPDTLDTWFTVALSNNTGCTYNVDCGFIDGGARQSDGIIPLDGMGTYADDANTDTVMELFGGAFYPVQYSFPMGSVGTTYTANFDAFAEGTILFHARVLRNGISDAAGEYTTSLDMTFAETLP